MSLIPFILDLADELHEFSRCLANGIDINDFGFGLYTGTDQQQPQQNQSQQQQPQQQQQQQQPQTSPRRSRTSSFSSFWMPSKRHHPYNRIKTACCAKSGEEAVAGNPENSGKETTGSSSVVGAAGGTPGKSASYSVVNKNGFQVSMNVKQFAPNELSVKTIDNCIVVEGRHDDKEDGHGVISRHFVRKYMLPKGYDPNDVLSTLSSDGILTVKAPPPPPPAAKNDEPNERIIEIQPTPGPTPVLVVSAKDMPAKETSKKLPTTTTTVMPSARLECQLPEKRQKLDIPAETEPEEAVASSAPLTPATNTVSETDAASSVAVAGTEIESDDVDMEKADEQINEIVLKQTEQQQQQQSDVEAAENLVEKNDDENIEQTEKQIAKEQGEQDEIEVETEKKLLDECMSDSNGEAKNDCEKMEESNSITDATESAAAADTEKTNETTPAATQLLEEESSVEMKSNVTKMEIDGDGEVDNDANVVVGVNVAKKKDNTEIFVAILKTCTSKTAVKPAAAAISAADSAKQKKETETTNNTDTSNSSSTNTTTNNNNNTSTNSNNTTTTTTTNTTNSTSASTDVATENSAKDVKDGNGVVVTGEIPDDIPKSATATPAAAAATEDSDTATAAKVTTDNNSQAESVAEGDFKVVKVVLSSHDVALLKAATADTDTDITDNAEENNILTESMDGITTTTTDSNNTTTTNTVDNVECSTLFAKKSSHLGNGNNTTTATPLVGTEEMAN